MDVEVEAGSVADMRLRKVGGGEVKCGEQEVMKCA